MYPTIFGFIDSYSLLLIIGVISSILLANKYFKKCNRKQVFIIDFDIIIIVSVIIGLVFACLLQNLYNFIEDQKNYSFTTALTFLGGLIGGVLGFIIIYFVYFRKKYGACSNELFKIVPAGITLAHGFGRIGCFLAGCCYGKESDSIFAVKFPNLSNSVLPTQLFEAIFLFILSAILIVLAFKFDYKYSLIIYLVSYGVFRFLIEFIRGDHRGEFLFNLTPSQFWSIVMIILAIPLSIYIYKVNKNEK